jgi:hypothetical protein
MSRSLTAASASSPRWPVRLYNRVAGLKAGVGFPAGPLDADEILRTARRRTGLRDLGGEESGEALRILAESFEADGRLNPFGRFLGRSILIQAVSYRLQILERLRQEPELLQTPLERPFFVVGFPRTGTTVLFNLLAQDPRARPLLHWEAFHPVAVARRRGGGTDPRIRRSRAGVRMLNYLLPELDRIHPVRAEEPEECLPLLQNSLVSWSFLLSVDARRYEEWLWALPENRLVQSYRFHRAQLQLLERSLGSRHWLLKSPAHLQALRPLLSVYPDARLIQTHRDPAEMLPSACSLFAVFRGLLSGQVDPRNLGRHGLDAFGRIVERMLLARAEIPGERVFDVHFEDLVADPVAMVHRIYGHFGETVSGEMDSRMKAFMEANPRHKHGVHRYTMEQFGLTSEEADDTFRPYMERFDLDRDR